MKPRTCFCFFLSGRSTSSISVLCCHQLPELRSQLCPQLFLSQVGLCDRMSSSERVLVEIKLKRVPSGQLRKNCAWARCSSLCDAVCLCALKGSCILGQKQPQGLRTSVPCTGHYGHWPGSDRDLSSYHHLQTFRLCEQQPDAEKPVAFCSSAWWLIYLSFF